MAKHFAARMMRSPRLSVVSGGMRMEMTAEENVGPTTAAIRKMMIEMMKTPANEGT